MANILDPAMGNHDPSLAASITRAASKQTYYTIRFLVDRDLIPDAYRAYGYFRWVDDQLDQAGIGKLERIAFVKRQRMLIDRCYQGERPLHLADEETMLVDLIRSDQEKNSGLQSYIRNMLAVMSFDAQRRGHLISQEELTGYTRNLATAVTEAMHYFIGHKCQPPQDEARYLAATAAHITHMLRDTLEDIQTGYFNIPREMIVSRGINPSDVWSDAYRSWVQSRVRKAQAYFKAGRNYLAQVENLRCRVAGLGYIARFEEVLDVIEGDNYRLRSNYPECKSLGGGLRMSWSTLLLAFNHRHPGDITRPIPAR